ncbi:MAG: ACT domain-containing protein [Ruminococcaceae bacterium]|jgi:ACT domain-containing protein|nr:ACT domain-containing protein [Oscillospiraceae bacterium]
MRVIVTVYGLDRVGIIYGVCKLLAEANVNILDISQTVMQEFFTMTMLADMSGATKELVKLREQLNELGKEIGVTIRIQSEDIFTAMHTV